MPNIPRSELKFLLSKNTLYVNTATSSPIHLTLGFLCGLIPKAITLEILNSGPVNFESKSLQLMGRALLGGYCELVSENPLQFKYTKPSTSIPAALDSDFDTAQSNGNIILVNYTSQNVYDSDLYKL